MKNGNDEKIINVDPLIEEEKRYRESLSFYKECSACHYGQGLIFFGIGFFSAVRMHFIWNTLKFKQILGYTSICILFTTLGVYKITYAFHIFKTQERVNKFKQTDYFKKL